MAKITRSRAAEASGSQSAPRFSRLDRFKIGPDTGFVMVAARTNVTGSTRFAG